MQSIRPYKGTEARGVAIFGLDTEYVPKDGDRADLLCWQLAGVGGVRMSTKPFGIRDLYETAKDLDGNNKETEVYVFVTYFAIAELQFFTLADWQVSEFKGKYKLTQNYLGKKLMVIDLANWYPKQKLADMAKLWGEEKLEYPIGEKVMAISAGAYTKQELLLEDAFWEYAKHDAVLNQKIYTAMREYFLKEFQVDIVNTLTTANTSASIFRKTVTEPIGQPDTTLRKLALECCWGGRMECLFRGEKEEVYEYDATGHHPNSAIALGFLPKAENWRGTTNLRTWQKAYGGLGHVYFRFPYEERYPCLPVFHNDSLLFPLEGDSFCSLSEAKLALSKGARLVLFSGYFFEEGTTLLADYLLRLQKIRNASSDPAKRQLLKLLSNSVIGKLFQKTIGVDLQRVQAYALEHDIPIEEAMKVKDQDFGAGEVSVGSCFYPEWYSLILGYARFSIGKVSQQHKALVISSDSFTTEENLGEKLEQDGITYSLKEKGKLVSYRTRFYRVGEKLAHHAVHNRDTGAEILESFRGDGVVPYQYRRFLHLRESWRDGKPFGSQKMCENMTVNLGFDFKRRLLSDGSTVPWKNVEEMDEFLGSYKKLERDTSRIEKKVVQAHLDLK